MKCILITGGRDFGKINPRTPLTFPRKNAERETVFRALKSFGETFRIIQGGASGADAAARVWAKQNAVDCFTYDAKWTDLSNADAVIKTRYDGTKYDALAGHRRNQLMLIDGKPDLVLAFPGGTGTADMIKRAEAAGVEVRRITHEGRTLNAL